MAHAQRRSPSLPALPSLPVLPVLIVMVCSLSLLVSTAALAQEFGGGTGGASQAVGKIGLGYTHGNAPLGIRMWFAPDMGFDAGLGIVLHGNENDVESPGDETTTTDFALDGGFLFSLYQGQNSILFGRVGLNFDRRYADGTNNAGQGVYSSVDTLSVSLLGGVEIFLGAFGLPELALQGAVGIAFENVSPPERPGPDNDDWTFGSMATGLSVVSTAQLGFHYYF